MSQMFERMMVDSLQADQLMDRAVSVSIMRSAPATTDFPSPTRDWRRMVIQVKHVIVQCICSIVMRGLEELRDRRETHATQKLIRVASDKTRGRLLGATAKPKAHTGENSRPRPMAKGKPLRRSTVQNWIMEVEECSHPFESLSRPRGGQGGSAWFTCLRCGGRWERVYSDGIDQQSAAVQATTTSTTPTPKQSTAVVQPVTSQPMPRHNQPRTAVRVPMPGAFVATACSRAAATQTIMIEEQDLPQIGNLPWHLQDHEIPNTMEIAETLDPFENIHLEQLRKIFILYAKSGLVKEVIVQRMMQTATGSEEVSMVCEFSSHLGILRE